ncbi:lipocalin-like domain-containing protein [Francisella uliginis]|uniref:Lipocalin-like domain-containing protein n=1 Tax=Francisella uliginis TaxID=573570 RepID=A0A1L4BRT0_9GAMM|nr:lipocalin-like domain-containing protein [Francisella uliginis]API86544.1 hypothetical protein F7310_03880 [Francisella uliginis]
MTSKLLGAWSLEKVYAKDDNNQTTYPLGIKPKGLLIYTENKMSGSGELSEELLNDKDYSLKPFFYYSGYYEIKDNIIIHYVELSNQMEWKNRKLIRYFKFINSSTVEIRSEEVLGNTKYTMIFTWVRC